MKVFFSSFIANVLGFDFIIYPYAIFFRKSLVRLQHRAEIYPVICRLRIIRRVGARYYYWAMTVAFFVNCFREKPYFPFKELENRHGSAIDLTKEEYDLIFN